MSDPSPSRCRVLRPGLLTTVQDLGRFGYQRFGMPVGGAMDPFALRCANRLVGNVDGAAVLEITLNGPELRFEQETMIALTGGEFAATVDGAAVSTWTAVHVGAGATVAIGARRQGARGYLAIAGGIEVPTVLGSRSTHLGSRTGGVEGRALRTGDVLMTGAFPAAAMARCGRTVPAGARSWYAGQSVLHVLPGPDRERFRPESLAVLTHEPYVVTPESDRMGYRLSGRRLVHAGSADIISEATPLGALQVPANGCPILLMADRQTTGGYPVIGFVITADIPLAAQAMPGDTVRFSLAEPAEARRLLRDRRGALDAVLAPVTGTHR